MLTVSPFISQNTFNLRSSSASTSNICQLLFLECNFYAVSPSSLIQLVEILQYIRVEETHHSTPRGTGESVFPC